MLYYTHIQTTGDMAWHVVYRYMYSCIPGGQKSQSGNQVAVSTDFNYSRTLDQTIRAIYKFCGISGKGSHSNH